MSWQKWILNIVLSILDICTFWMKPNPKRITFVSMTMNEYSEDFLLLKEALEQDYEIDSNLIVFQKNILGKLGYFFNCLKQEIDFKKSSLVILNDNNYVLSRKKPKGCHVLQVWHACGAIKKFGNEINRSYTIENYDSVLCNAQAWKPIYARSFGVDENQIQVTGMPRVDRLLKGMDTKSFYAKYPQCKGKKLCLYAPTFRGNILEGFQHHSFDIPKVQEQLKDWTILVKFHPLLEDVELKNTSAINVSKEDLYELMQVSDCLISDYSSVILDYSLLHRPIIGYMNDMDQYQETIGLNIDASEYPGPICYNEDQLIQTIQKVDSLDIAPVIQFQEKYMVYVDGKNTDRTVQYIHSILD